MSAKLTPVPDQHPVESGLPLFEGTSWEDHVSSWFEISEAVESAQWMRGAIVSSLDTNYGKGAVEKFAGEIMMAARTLWLYRQVHSFYQNCNRLQNLSWKHHLVAMYAPNPDVALRMADDEGLSAANLARKLKVRLPATGDELPLLATAHVSHNSGENEWYTPPEYIEAARSLLGRIDLDPASSKAANKCVQAEDFYSLKEDGLKQEWKGRVWMNPPYASDLIGKFTNKRLQQGKSAETKIANWLRYKCKYSIVPVYEVAEGQFKGPQVFTPSSELVAPDMFAFKDGRVRWVEAKHKSIFSWYRIGQRWVTGIDRHHYRDYLQINLESPWPVWLLFYHTKIATNEHGQESPTGLFGNDLITLQDRRDHESPNWGKHGMIYWAHADLVQFATCEEVEAIHASVKRLAS